MSLDVLKVRDTSTTYEDSMPSPTLLRPPDLIECHEKVPFKPGSEDQTSLSMKKFPRGRRRHRWEGLNRASTGGARLESQSVPPRHASRRAISISEPDLRHVVTSLFGPPTEGQLFARQQLSAFSIPHRSDISVRSVETKRRASLPYRKRRWTMPIKSTSTRFLSETPMPIATTAILASKEPKTSRSKSAGLATSQSNDSTSCQGETDLGTGVCETPAVITLRRATVKTGPSTLARRASLRPNAIVSFPTPTFDRTTSAYFSSLFGLKSTRDPSKNDEPIQTSIRQASWNTGEDVKASTQKASVTADSCHIHSNGTAIPAFTKVEFLPLSQAHAEHQAFLALSSRRCSTTIVSGSSVHEIIWDENISSSGGSCSPETTEQMMVPTDQIYKASHHQRQSALVEKLEGQLRDSDYRNQSWGISNLRESGTLAGQRECAQSKPQKLTPWSTGRMTDTDRSLQDSCSRTLRPALKPTIWVSASEALVTRQEAGSFPPPDGEVVDFFPPLENTVSSTRRSSLTDPRCSQRQVKHVMIEQPLVTLIQDAVPFAEPWGEGQGKSRCASSHPPHMRKSHLPNRHSTMGTAIGQSAHVRRRSSILDKSSCGDRSRRTINKVKSKQRHGFDERTRLLEDCQRSDRPLWPPICVEGQAICASSSGRHLLTMGPPKTSIQHCPHEIERSMSRAWPCSAEYGTCNEPTQLRMVRRDTPWPLRRWGSEDISDVETDRSRIPSMVGEEGLLSGVPDL
jgi:hypothetical protein